MTTDQFNNLKEGDFFYHSSCAYVINMEFVVLENKNNIIRAKCTLAGGFYNEGDEKEFTKDLAGNFKVGEHPMKSKFKNQ
jgi:hypothetical protein